MPAGRAISGDRCSACHVDNGAGIEHLFSKIAGAPLVSNADARTLIRIVIAGSRAGDTDARSIGPAMPSFGCNLSDEDVAQVLTYLRNGWGNAASGVSDEDVARSRQELMSDTR